MMTKEEFIKWVKSITDEPWFSVDVPIEVFSEYEWDILLFIEDKFESFKPRDVQTDDEMFKEWLEEERQEIENQYKTFMSSGWVNVFFDMVTEQTEYIPEWEGKKNPADDIPWIVEEWDTCDCQFDIWKMYIERYYKE